MSVTDNPNPVDAVVEILEATDTAEWQNTKPKIFRADESTPQGRENETGDAIYVRSVQSLQLERFSADPQEQTEDGTVEVLVYSLSERRSREHARDIVGFFRDLLNDNYDQTDFLTVEPTQITDNRAAKAVRQTDHFIFIVEITTHRLAPR